MNNKIFTLLSIAILLCSCNNASKGQQVNNHKDAMDLISEAYENNNWDLVISIGDTLIGDDDPKNISIIYAEALASKGNIEKAIHVLDNKIAIKPDDYYLLQTKGNVYYVAENYDSAIVCYDKVIDMRPTYARPYVYEGEIYAELGEKQKAIARYLEAIELFATNNLIDETLFFSNRVLELDSANVDAKRYIKQVQASQEQ